MLCCWPNEHSKLVSSCRSVDWQQKKVSIFIHHIDRYSGAWESEFSRVNKMNFCNFNFYPPISVQFTFWQKKGKREKKFKFLDWNEKISRSGCRVSSSTHHRAWTNMSTQLEIGEKVHLRNRFVLAYNAAAGSKGVIERRVNFWVNKQSAEAVNNFLVVNRLLLARLLFRSLRFEYGFWTSHIIYAFDHCLDVVLTKGVSRTCNQVCFCLSGDLISIIQHWAAWDGTFDNRNSLNL